MFGRDIIFHSLIFFVTEQFEVVQTYGSIPSISRRWVLSSVLVNRNEPAIKMHNILVKRKVSNISSQIVFFSLSFFLVLRLSQFFLTLTLPCSFVSKLTVDIPTFCMISGILFTLSCFWNPTSDSKFWFPLKLMVFALLYLYPGASNKPAIKCVKSWKNTLEWSDRRLAPRSFFFLPFFLFLELILSGVFFLCCD